MRPIGVDARRFAWCGSNSLWLVGMPTNIFLEDLEGARDAGQDGLVRYVARMIGDHCAVALNVALNDERPIPSATMRDSWALERLQGHELRDACWELIRGTEEASADEIVAACKSLVESVFKIVGEIPNALTPEGHYPAIALARDWVKLMEAVGEKTPMPYNWKPPRQPST
jgi:hypothetical protein